MVPGSSAARAFTFLAACALLLLGRPAALHAAPPPEAEVEKEEAEQNKAISEAQRAGSTARVVVTYESRYGRQRTVLSHYLYARALFHHGDRAGAMREMKELAEAEPDFWQVHVRLSYLYGGEKNLALARQHLEKARARAPEAIDVLMQSVDVGKLSKDWDLALSALKRLQTLRPDDPAVHYSLADVYRAKGDWPAAYGELRWLRLKFPKEQRLRALYAYAAHKTEHTDEAAQEFEALAAENGAEALPYLGALAEIYLTKKDLKALEVTLARIRPLLDLTKVDAKNLGYLGAVADLYREKKDWKAFGEALRALLPYVEPEKRPGLEKIIADLAAGKNPEERPTEQPKAQPTEEDYTLDLFERCLSPDVATRRAALMEFFEAGPLGIPKALQVRYHPAEEPDPECRAWVIKLVGALKADPATGGADARDQFAKIPGHALQDPTSLVRRVASEVLGEIGTSCGVLYLMPNVGDLTLGADAKEDVVQEYNAARRAYVRLTGFDDLEVGASPWVPAADLEASRHRWDAWFASPAGVTFLKKAIADLVRTGETHPEWYLVYQLYVGHPEVARAAYDALLARSAEPHKDPTAERLYPTFPKLRTSVDGKALGPAESFQDAVVRLKAWWREWINVRAGAGK